MLTGTERKTHDNTTRRARSIRTRTPTSPPNITGAPATSYNLELINPDFKFPQIWRTQHRRGPQAAVRAPGTVEFIYNQDVNGISYINANLPAAQATFTGADQRLRWTGTRAMRQTVGPCSIRINNAAGNRCRTAVVLENQNVGRAWNIAAIAREALQRRPVDQGRLQLRRGQEPDRSRFHCHRARGRPTRSRTIPTTRRWRSRQYSPGHRFFVTGSYSRNFFKFGMTTVSVVLGKPHHRQLELRVRGRRERRRRHVERPDLHPARPERDELRAVHVVSGVTYTSAQQAAAWDAYINQDPYLSQHRGEYAVRNAVFLPFVHRLDFSASQDVTFKAWATDEAHGAVPHGHRQLHEPAEPRLGRQPAPREQPAADQSERWTRHGRPAVPPARRQWRADEPHVRADGRRSPTSTGSCSASATRSSERQQSHTRRRPPLGGAFFVGGRVCFPQK